MVSEQIQELLHEHDCVIIPDFGGLIAQYAPARIHPVKHTVTPPSKKIAFNEKLKHNDGLLISNLSQQLRISQLEAQKLVSQFVNNLQTDLNQTQKCELKGIGIFRYNAERKIEFEYVANENFLEHSFGLPELVAKPIIPVEAAALRAMRYQKARPEKIPAKNKLNRFIDKYATVAGTVLLGGLTISLIYLVSLQTDYNLSSLNPASLFQRNAKTESVPEQTEPKITENTDMTGINSLPVTPEAESVSAVEQDSAIVISNDKAANAIEVVEPDSKSVDWEETAPEVTKAAPAKIAVVLPAKPEVKVGAPVKTEKIAAAKSEIKAVEEKVSETKIVPAIKSKTGRYFIIFGGFASKINAERCQKDLQGKGAASDIILPAAGHKLHRVSVAEFETMETATAKLPELRKKYGNALWILNY